MLNSILPYVSLGVLGPALLLAAACGGGGDDGDDANGPPRPGGEETATPRDGEPTRSPGASDTSGGSCNVRITGDIDDEFTSPGGASAVGADYFMSDDEIRAALGFFGATPTAAELDDDVVELFLLLVNCVSTDDAYSITFFPGNDSTYSDVPFGPGKYVIVPGGLLGGSVKGEFGVLATLNDLSLGVAEPGEFNITAWDDDHIAGNFSFAMKEPEIFATGTPKSVEISGEFDFKAP